MRPQLTNSNASCGSGSDEIYAERDSHPIAPRGSFPIVTVGGELARNSLTQSSKSLCKPPSLSPKAETRARNSALMLSSCHSISETMPTKLTIDVTPVFHPEAARDRAPGKCRARRPFVWMVGPYGRSVSAGRIWPDLRIPAYSNGSKQCTCAALSQQLQERPETRQGEQKGKWQRDEFGQGPSAKGVVRPRTGPADAIANHSAHDHCTKNDKHVPGIPLHSDNFAPNVGEAVCSSLDPIVALPLSGRNGQGIAIRFGRDGI